MKTTKQDKLLSLLEEEKHIPAQHTSKPILKELEEKGLVEKNVENSYNLTSYGELVKIMGYKTYKTAEEFEKEIPKYTPQKTRMLGNFLLIILFALLTVLFLIFLRDFDQVIIDYLLNIV